MNPYERGFLIGSMYATVTTTIFWLIMGWTGYWDA